MQMEPMSIFRSGILLGQDAVCGPADLRPATRKTPPLWLEEFRMKPLNTAKHNSTSAKAGRLAFSIDECSESKAQSFFEGTPADCSTNAVLATDRGGHAQTPHTHTPHTHTYILGSEAIRSIKDKLAYSVWLLSRRTALAADTAVFGAPVFLPPTGLCPCLMPAEGLRSTGEREKRASLRSCPPNGSGAEAKEGASNKLGQG